MIRVIDLETTGLPPEADVVEAAFLDVDEIKLAPKASDFAGHAFLVKTLRPVTPEARAAHHLTDVEISHGSGWSEVHGILAEGSIFCAHNADFEMAFFNPPSSRWIDTYKCALRLWPDAPRHTNQVLRYFLDGCDPGKFGMPPHRALPDCRVTARILLRCLEASSVEQLVAWSNEPPLLPRVPMGKHRTKLWADVPTDYLEWVLRSEFEPAVAHTARVELQRRRGTARV